MASRDGLGWRARVAAGAALTVSVAVLAVALIVTAGARAAGAELRPRLVAAAAGTGRRAGDYSARQASLRGSITSGSTGLLTALRAGAQQARGEASVTGRLVREQDLLVAALVAMGVLTVLIAAAGVVTVRRRLLRPFTQVREAAEAVAGGDYGRRIPAVGPAGLVRLSRSTEEMRIRLAASLADLTRAGQSLRDLYDSVPDAMLTVDARGIIVMANIQAENLFGYAIQELTGLPVDMLVPERARGLHAGHRHRYTDDPYPRPMGAGLRLSALRRDGSEIPVEISLNSMRTDQGLVVAAVRDITERLAAQAERDRVREEAERERVERRRLQSQRLESLGQLVGGVAHDFNNLLNVITGYTGLVAGEISALSAADARLRPVLADIGQVNDAAEQATRLTRQLLTFARHDVVKSEVVDLHKVVHRVEQLLRRTLGERIDLVISSAPDLWLVVADRGQLEQVLVNLAVNARDAMPDGGQLTIDTCNARVDETYAEERPGLRPGRYVRLRVSDTGSGMDRATVDRAFEPFFTTKPKGHGTGLGLATVYGIITQAGGTVQIYSEPGLGTTISALLPANGERQQQGSTAAAGPAQGTAAGRGETILLVEDEDSLRELTRRLLARHGYQVTVALTGAEAARRAEDPSSPVDLLLTDVVMPEMLGSEVAARVRAARPGVPVLYMSGYAQPVLDSRGGLDPPGDILEKPFTENALLAKVRQTLDQDPYVPPRPSPRPAPPGEAGDRAGSEPPE